MCKSQAYHIMDKVELLQTNRYIHSLLSTNPICWAPLDLSLYGDRITNTVLLSILRSRSLPIITPLYQPTVSNVRPKTYQLHNINISGCHLLNADAVLMLVRSLQYLTTLHLNKYAATSVPEPLARHPRHYRRTRSKMIDMLRDDLYQCRPRHGLSSSTMDLSKQPLASLALSDSTLQKLLQWTPFLTDLSLQHQPLSMTICKSMHTLLPQLRHLDISSCDISIPGLQLLIRNLAGKLSSLKMLNLELSNLTLLCLQLYGSSLECLHLSCLDPQSLPGIARIIKWFENLTDFRLTRLRSGNVDDLISALASHPPPLLLRCLDLSPKLEIYPKFIPISTPSSKKHPTCSPLHLFNNNNNNMIPTTASSSLSRSNTYSQQSGNIPSSSSRSQQHCLQPSDKRYELEQKAGKLPPHVSSSSKRSHLFSSTSFVYGPYHVQFTRSERDLCMTDTSMLRLASFSHLVELRLCFPTIQASTLSQFLKTATCPLQILELRLRPSSSSSSSLEEVDYLDGLHHLIHLHTLLLYSVPLTQRSAESILALGQLQSLTVHDAKQLGKLYPFFLRRWLLELPRLTLLRMDLVSFAWTTVADMITTTTEQHEWYHAKDPLYDGDSMFVRSSFGKWEWVT
ncbi:uncharacterized protein BX664DRAFT_382855 [Halteromyces radiatus]|uniref:uncharacterized protein n=1 Tax=Halteromyces radiatus TaxID=101107 RepID=UPI0022203B47|nr:uncharacterized protein BX664DRAFT_382855 [Halteromyces radiatus]KAI8096401.1 hypothetical protein BX664DRAFT_382855 [Halteromyces radiatus]